MTLSEDTQVVGFYDLKGDPAYLTVARSDSDAEVQAAVFRAKHGREVTSTEKALARVLENASA
jgi:hypothetical protein